MVGGWWTTRQNALLECSCFRREPESLSSNPDILGYTSQLEGAPLAYPGMPAGVLLWETALSRRCKHYVVNSYQANVFDPKHLAGASSDLVWSMVKVGRKAVELERVKLQTEIIKEQS